MNNKAIDLSEWIDTTTGDVLKNMRHPDEMVLLEEVYRKGVEDLLGTELLYHPNPRALLFERGLHIKLSEEINYCTTKVYPGVSPERLPEKLDDWGGTSDFPKEKHSTNTREMPIEYRYVMLGEFRPSTVTNRIGTIWLYPKAMASCEYRTNSDFETVFWATLAHELFHAFHYYHLKLDGKVKRWSSGRKKDRELVMESLAAFFEYSFLFYMPNGYRVKNYIENKWASLDVDGWPYSGALGIEHSRNDRLFATLFEMSFRDWKTAADIIRTGYYLCSPEIARELEAWFR